jgi:hypothetical protein
MQAPPTTWAVCPDIVTRRLGDLLVVVSLSSNRIFELNHTGARVWEMMTSGFDEPRAVAALTEEFDVTPESALQEVRALRAQLIEEGLIESSDAR